MIEVMDGWCELVSEVLARRGPAVIYVMGASDRGKTTFCRYLAQSLGREGLVASVDCDPGQSRIGPPSTIGLELSGRMPSNSIFPGFLFFTGSVSPAGHLLQNLSGTGKLVGRARELGARFIILDSSGYALEPAAREFQFALIDLLGPDFIVPFGYEGELEGILSSFARRRGATVRRMMVPPFVRPRSPLVRQEYRRSGFREYFRNAHVQIFPLEGKGAHGGMPAPDPEGPGYPLAGLCDGDNFLLALAMVQGFDEREGLLKVFAPPFDQDMIGIVQPGSLLLDARDYAAPIVPSGR